MHRYHNNNSNLMAAASGACSCGYFHSPNITCCSSNNMFYSDYSSSNTYNMEYYSAYDDGGAYDNNAYPSPTMNQSSSPMSVVDCTLSLGTPSTRSHEQQTASNVDHSNKHHSKRSTISNLCWDLFQTKKQQPKQTAATNAGGRAAGATGDSLLARRCANCDTTSTPLWRNGPRGPKSLCNACGIRYKKEERRAASSSNNMNTTSSSSSSAAAAASANIDHHQHSWSSHHQYQSTVVPAGAMREFMFVNDEVAVNNPYLSWRLNVPERSGLVHDYTY